MWWTINFFCRRYGQDGRIEGATAPLPSRGLISWAYQHFPSPVQKETGGREQFLQHQSVTVLPHPVVDLVPTRSCFGTCGWNHDRGIRAILPQDLQRNHVPGSLVLRGVTRNQQLVGLRLLQAWTWVLSSTVWFERLATYTPGIHALKSQRLTLFVLFGLHP